MPFTKLTNVPVKESMTGNEKIIINDDGVTRQTNIPNYVKTIGGVTPDQNGNVEIELGESWPSDLPKPSVGGYGYTEQGDGAVITWDGNPDGLPDAFGAKMYKVSDKTPTKEELASGRFIHNEEEYEINEETDITVGVNCLMVHYSENETAYRIFVAYENGVVFGDETIEEAGTYFANSRSTGTVTSLTYGTPDTVHKIDEKYLPASGGAMVVNIEREYDTMVADKPFDEVYSAWKTGCVIARVDTGNGIVDLRPLTDVATDTTTSLVFTGVTYTAEHGILYKLNWGSFSGVEKLNLAVRKLQLADI